METINQEETEALERLRELYEDRALEEQGYSFDQWCKVMRLRYEAQRDRDEKQKQMLQREQIESKRLREGDRVRFQYKVESQQFTLTGHIRNKNTDGTYDIENHLGVFRNVNRYGMSAAPEKDWSHVQVPEALKSVNTELLLRKFKYYRSWEYPRYVYDSYWDYVSDHTDYDNEGQTYQIGKGIHATLDQMRAELSTREHVVTATDRKIQKHLKK